MNNFEFEVIEYFRLHDGQSFGLVGNMKPDNFPIITKDYSVKLITNSGREYIFSNIGEEIVVRSNPEVTVKRALRTTDDIERYLQDLPNDPIKIIGCK